MVFEGIRVFISVLTFLVRRSSNYRITDVDNDEVIHTFFSVSEKNTGNSEIVVSFKTVHVPDSSKHKETISYPSTKYCVRTLNLIKNINFHFSESKVFHSGFGVLRWSHKT